MGKPRSNYKIFTLRSDETGEMDMRAVNVFCNQNRVVEHQSHFIQDELGWCLVFLLRYIPTYQEHRPKKQDFVEAPVVSSKTKKNAFYTLHPEQQELYERIRLWRNITARESGRPPYAICNNDMIADISQRIPTTKKELKKVDGIGDGFCRAYGDAIFAIVSEWKASTAKQPIDNSSEDKSE